MEVVRERPPGYPSVHELEPLQLRPGYAPTPIMNAARAVGRAAEEHFPMLHLVRAGSPAYEDEELWLDAEGAQRLLDELRSLRSVGRREAFVRGLDGVAAYERWRGGWERERFEEWLDELEAYLAHAVEADGAVLLLL